MSDDDDIRVRNVAMLCPYEGTRIWIDHLWEAEPREDGHADEGEVGIMIEADGQSTEAFPNPGDALLLADRIPRAADLALETREDQPDLDREYLHWTRRPRPCDNENGLGTSLRWAAVPVFGDRRYAAGRPGPGRPPVTAPGRTLPPCSWLCG